MKNWVLMAIIISILTGCATAPPSSQSVMATGGVMSAAGAPGGGVMVSAALAMEFAEWVTSIDKPKFTSLQSIKVHNFMSQMPRVGYENGRIKWLPRIVEDNGNKRVITAENIPPEMIDLALLILSAPSRWRNGDFGDTGEESLKRNLDAWREGKQVVAEYKGQKSSKVLIVSNNREEGRMYFYDEWMEMNSKQNKSELVPTK